MNTNGWVRGVSGQLVNLGMAHGISVHVHSTTGSMNVWAMMSSSDEDCILLYSTQTDLGRRPDAFFPETPEQKAQTAADREIWDKQARAMEQETLDRVETILFPACKDLSKELLNAE